MMSLQNESNFWIKFMIQASMKKQHSHRKMFRNQMISKMFSLRDNFPGIYRSTQCLAIMIADHFQQVFTKANNQKAFTQIDIELFTLSVLWISCLKLKSFIDVITNDKTQQQNRQQLINMEIDILTTINFDVPLVTAYDLLNEAIPLNQFQSGNQQRVIICLAIFMSALVMEPTLSLLPHLGKQFYKITKQGEGSEMAIHLFKKSQKRLIKQKKSLKQ